MLKKVHQRIFNQRNNFLHEESRKIVESFGVICVEDLNFKGLAGGMLSRSAHGAGWSSFITKFAYKAESAGRKRIQVDPRGTSQRALVARAYRNNCQTESMFVLNADSSSERDHISATEILRRGTSLQGRSTVPLAVLP
jgi:IS605 OrfB family transposase